MIKKRKYKKRERDHATEYEIQQILNSCHLIREPERYYSSILRNKLMILMTYNHALRSSETCNLKWIHVNLHEKTVWITRCKGSKSGLHPIESQMELDLLHELHALRNPKLDNLFIVSDYKGQRPATPWFFNVICERIGEKAGLPYVFTPRMLRSGKITYLCDKDINLILIRNFAGHVKVSSTEYYLRNAANRFKGINNGSLFA